MVSLIYLNETIFKEISLLSLIWDHERFRPDYPRKFQPRLPFVGVSMVFCHIERFSINFYVNIFRQFISYDVMFSAGWLVMWSRLTKWVKGSKYIIFFRFSCLWLPSQIVKLLARIKTSLSLLWCLPIVRPSGGNILYCRNCKNPVNNDSLYP